MSEEKSYTLRELEADDLFLMVSILRKIGVDRIKLCLEATSVKAAIKIMMDEQAETKAKEEAISSIGIAVMMEIAGAVLERLPDCKEEIYNLLTAVSGMKREEIAHMKIVPLMRMIKEFFRKPDFRDFFTEAIEFLN